MAEGISKLQDNVADTSNNVSILECAVCLQTCVHPAELPCGHIFCFLCVKGIAFQSGRCAMCREAIPHEFLHKPKLVAPLTIGSVEDTYQWYYEGYSGWWQYDQRASSEIEDAYQKGEKTCQLLLAGFLYSIDFNSMVQYRQTNPGRRRRIKRDRATTDKLGVAGLRPDQESTSQQSRPADLAQSIESIRFGLQEVEVGAPNLWQSSERSIQSQSDSSMSSTLDLSGFSRSDSENYGLESLLQEFCPNSDQPLSASSPAPRDGRSVNPRFELCEVLDSDEEDDVEVVEGPLMMLSGPNAAAPEVFRPLPRRANTDQETETIRLD